MKKRDFISKTVLLLLVPAIIAAGIYALDKTRYYLISTFIIFTVLAAFFLLFERRDKHIRELVIIAVLCAVAIIGRAFFFWVPQVKPMLAITILTGIALNPQCGFMVGAVSIFVSNMFFSQGPWTPWQMVALGLSGFVAGVLFKKGRIPRNVVLVSVYGAVSAFVIYGGIVNLSSLFMSGSTINLKMLLAVYISALPFDIPHSISTFIFLIILTYPFLFLLERMNSKFDLFGQS